MTHGKDSENPTLPPPPGFGELAWDAPSRESWPEELRQPDAAAVATLTSPGAPLERQAHVTVPAPPLPPLPESGTLIDGKYELLEQLASGGMGRVYLARHRQLRTPLAIKIMHDFIAASPEHAERFRREALAASKLNHPHVVKVIDYGSLGSTLYIVMELVEGRSLGKYLDERDTPPDLSEILPILLQILDALTAAHDRGIVHRDLKPDNVILGTDLNGQVHLKVVDFGLARFRDPEQNDVTMTQVDAVAGTPAYMSPEQCRSLRVTHSTDLYAFGCILTELLQLAPPFVGETVIDTISKHLFSPVPPLARPEGCEPVPQPLERLRRDLLAKLPSQRPLDARTTRARLAAAFSGVALGEPESARDDREARPGSVSREARLPAWNLSPKTHESLEVPTGSAIGYWAASGSVRAIREPCLLGLRAQGFQVEPIGESSDFSEWSAVLIDGGDDAALTTRLTREARAKSRHTALIACVMGLTTETIGQLIESGADDVARGDVMSDALGRKLVRLLRRHPAPRTS